MQPRVVPDDHGLPRLTFANLAFRYEPYPIGVAKPVLPEDLYRDLVERYPPRDLFVYMPKFGHKYSLSEKFNGKAYQQFLRREPVWRAFHGWVKSEAFILEVMDALRLHGIDLGFGARPPATQRLLKTMKHLLRPSQKSRTPRLSARFEFSMLPADGGSVIPHTDLPSKVVTIIVSMVGEGEWDPAIGGGTDVNRNKNPHSSFNRLNARGRFEDMDVLDTFEFLPNQAVMFVKTFNSWHSVRPMTGVGSQAMRKTLTINIEAR
ncbi:MAG: hypothetical protein JNM75_13505 [Rhodospirillales bacterium]|nr:hypothetical protein [Rhodospirillales bacterium]